MYHQVMLSVCMAAAAGAKQEPGSPCGSSVSVVGAQTLERVLFQVSLATRWIQSRAVELKLYAGVRSNGFTHSATMPALQTGIDTKIRGKR